MNTADVQLLTRMLAANTLAQMPKCAGYWHREDVGGPIRDSHCGRAATQVIVEDAGCHIGRGDYLLRCDAHADVDLCRDKMRALPSAERIRELERIAWGK